MSESNNKDTFTSSMKENDSTLNRGGKREGSGRPKGTGKYGEPTKAIRVPEGSVSYIKDYLENEYDQNTKQDPIISNVVLLGSAESTNSENSLAIPLFSSKVAAGLPSYADDDLDDSIDLNDYLVEKPNSTFMLKVQGMSMKDAGILPDDILIVDRSERAAHNKIVIAALDGELTVKRLYKRADTLKLLPENPDYPEIIIRQESELIIWGVVVGSFRRFQATKFT
jgi:DNA polymerase V